MIIEENISINKSFIFNIQLAVVVFMCMGKTSKEEEEDSLDPVGAEEKKPTWEGKFGELEVKLSIFVVCLICQNSTHKCTFVH